MGAREGGAAPVLSSDDILKALLEHNGAQRGQFTAEQLLGMEEYITQQQTPLKIEKKAKKHDKGQPKDKQQLALEKMASDEERAAVAAAGAKEAERARHKKRLEERRAKRS